MFCSRCGKELEVKANFCQNCGKAANNEKNSSNNMSEFKNYSKNITNNVFDKFKNKSNKIILIIALLITTFAIILIITYLQHKNSIIDFDKYIESMEQTEETIIGTWSCADINIIFAEDGIMYIESKGITFGDGYFNFEIYDNSTLHMTGENIPVGIDADYKIYDGVLIIDLFGNEYSLTRE